MRELFAGRLGGRGDGAVGGAEGGGGEAAAGALGDGVVDEDEEMRSVRSPEAIAGEVDAVAIV